MTPCSLPPHPSLSLPLAQSWEDWWTWACTTPRPSLHLAHLRATDGLTAYPELHALIGCPQSPTWHPEGDVWRHTLLVCDEAATIAVRDAFSTHDRGLLVLAALCHDLGKPATLAWKPDGRPTSHGHETCLEPTAAFLARLQAPTAIPHAICTLIRHHLLHGSFTGSRRQARRVLQDLAAVDVPFALLRALMEADLNGRPPLPKGLSPALQTLITTVETLMTPAPQPTPLLLGRHLLALGVPASPHMGLLLRQALTAQQAGAFTTLEDALRWVRPHLPSPSPDEPPQHP